MLHIPVTNFDFFLPEIGNSKSWQSANNYCIWTELQSLDDVQYQLLVRPQDKVLTVPLKPRTMHLINAGTPFRITHLFAPWRRSDADTIYLRVQEPEGIYSLLLTAMSNSVRHDSALCICPACGKDAYEDTYDSRSGGLIEYWAFHLKYVRSISEQSKRCPSCEHVLPQGYGFDKALDTEHEARSRLNG